MSGGAGSGGAGSGGSTKDGGAGAGRRGAVGSSAIILAGGRASRLGGIDKPALRFRDRSLLEIAVDAAAGSAVTIVVGPQTIAGVLSVREEPLWGGPVVALAAGLRVLPAGHTEVLVLAADHPLVEEVVRRLRRVPLGVHDGVVARDAGGRRQPLLGRYRADALRKAVDSLLAERGSLAGASLRSLLAGLAIVEAPLPDELCADVDTPDDALRHGIVLAEAEHIRTTAPVPTTGDHHGRDR